MVKYKNRRLIKCTVSFMHKLATENSLRDLLYTGYKRNTPWKIYFVKYESAEPWCGAADEQKAKDLAGRLALSCTDNPYLVCFSGAKPTAFIVVKSVPSITFGSLVEHEQVQELHMKERMQGAAMLKLFDELEKDAVMMYGTIASGDEVKQAQGGEGDALGGHTGEAAGHVCG